MKKGEIAHNRKVKTVEELEKLWADYKNACDNKQVRAHEFSQKLGKFVSEPLTKSVSYTLEGFCIFIGISRNAFYESYTKAEPWLGAVTRIREECEVDAREKFELGVIPSQLAGLWMSNYGYGTLNAETDASNLVDEWVEAVLADEVETG